jgi:hypothetical protein
MRSGRCHLAATILACAAVFAPYAPPYVAGAQAQPAADQFAVTGDPYQAALVLFDRLSPYVSQADEATAEGGGCGPTDDGILACFDPNAVLEPTSGNGFIALQTRKVALQSVALYTKLLDDLAKEDNLPVAVRRSTELEAALAALAGLSSFGGPAAAMFGTAVAGTVAGLAETLGSSRSEDLMRQAVISGQPTVIELIDLLVADTAVMYEIYRSGRQAGIIAIQTEMLVAEHSGQTPPRGQHEIDLIVADINAYHSALYSYVVFLGQTRKAMDELAPEGAAGPPDSETARQRIKAASVLQITARALWAALTGVLPRATQ